MKKRRSGCLIMVILPVAALLCLGGLYGTNVLLELPDRAEAIFGPGASNLSRARQIWLSAMLLANEESLTVPVDPEGAGQGFVVELGESVASVLERLRRAGLIADPGALRTYLQYSGLDTTLQAGSYTLSPAMPPLEIARALQDATPTEVPFRVLAGWRLEEIAAALPSSGLEIEPQEFLNAARRRPLDHPLTPELPPGATVEGFLYPDLYTLPRSLKARELVTALLDRFHSQLDDVLRSGFAQQGLSVYEAVILASIVEKEAIVVAESPMLASVFLNRLQADVKLDADPTVQYALGYNTSQGTWWTNPLSLADLEVDSAYNTYRYPGLPPGPIANPGPEALRAVAFPAESPYYYFRAGCDGSGTHLFAETFPEHQANACP